MNINGNWMNFAYMDNPTLYTSAYLVASPQGYTKHYYAGSERIASAIGLGGLAIIDTPLELETYRHSWEDKSFLLSKEMYRTLNDCLGNAYSCKQTLEGLYHLTDPNTGTMDRYFYHPDHLGSSSWITDGSGNAIQHLHYLPFGEDWVDQRNSSWNTPYTFSGKEKDAETGYGYFGARYYDSGLSIWLSVDPMSDKYPSMSPYTYCANNPVILVDPDGRRVKGAGFIRNLFHTDGYCVAYLAAKARGIPEDRIQKINKENYTFTVMTGYDLWAGTSKRNYYYGVEIIHINVKDTPFRTNWGGIELYNTDNERDRPGADRKTNGDAPLTDITNFPTGTGAENGTKFIEALKFGFEVIEEAEKVKSIIEKAIDHQKKEALERYNNDTICVPDLPGQEEHWYNAKDWVPRRDSLKRSNEKKDEVQKQIQNN